MDDPFWRGSLCVHVPEPKKSLQWRAIFNLFCFLLPLVSFFRKEKKRKNDPANNINREIDRTTDATDVDGRRRRRGQELKEMEENQRIPNKERFNF